MTPYAEVIGDPVAHSKSPRIHRHWLAMLDCDGDYRTCRVTEGGLADFFAQRRSDTAWRGCNVTIPHKQAIMPYLDVLDTRAQAVGAVNTVWKSADGQLTGTNTDVDGVAEALDRANRDLRTALVLGAGGAARAAFRYLADRGCETRILARNPAKALDVAQSCGASPAAYAFEAGSGAFAGADVLINATQLGMTGQDPMPDFVIEQLGELADDALVFDMVYAPLETGLLRAARKRGLKTADGLTMLVGQAASAFERFFGCAPDRSADAALRRELVS